MEGNFVETREFLPTGFQVQAIMIPAQSILITSFVFTMIPDLTASSDQYLHLDIDVDPGPEDDL